MDAHGSNRATTDRIALAVDGMTCGSCAGSVERALTGVPGVERAVVDLSTGRALVEGEVRPEDLVGAIEAAGYAARFVGPSAESVRGAAARKSCCC